MQAIAQKNGVLFVPSTIPPMTRARPKQWSAETEWVNQEIQKVNTYIRSNYSQYADFHNLLKDSTNDNMISVKFDSKDGIHMNKAGYDVMREEVARVLGTTSWKVENSVIKASQETQSYQQDKKNAEIQNQAEAEKIRQNVTRQIELLKLSLAEAKNPEEKFEYQRQILRLKKFYWMQNGENINDEKLKKEIVDLLKWKNPDTYKNADLLTLKNKGIDIATLLLVDKKSDNEVVSASMKEGDEFVVNFGGNMHFARRTGAGDLLPPSVREIEINGIRWVRGNNPRPWYYTEQGKYLPIYDGYDIKITKIWEATKEDVIWIENHFQFSANANEPDKYKSVELFDISKLEKWDKWLLDFIAQAEWTGDNYNAIFGNGWQNKIDFTRMTLAEVRNVQRNHAAKTGSSAIGRYQFMGYTLDRLIIKHGLDRSEKFTPELQDRLAISLLEEKGFNQFKSWNKSFADMQVWIAQVWASVAKDSSGLSYYHGDKMNNKATSTGRQIAQVLRQLYDSNERKV